MLSSEEITLDYFLEHSFFETTDFTRFNYIALGAYCWNAFLLEPFIKKIRMRGFSGKIILGGYEITYSARAELSEKYPTADIFIIGYAEESLRAILKEENPKIQIWDNRVNFATLPSPYLSSTLSLAQRQEKIRWETKRGCPYSCSFCAHKGLGRDDAKKVLYHPLEKAIKELEFFREKQVKKINVLDPVFNMGKDYLTVLEAAYKIGLKSQLTLQTRVELITDEYLNHCARLNTTLEIGIQTMNPQEAETIQRKNDWLKINENLKKVKAWNIDFEASLIYGLPYQTYDSFRQSVNYLQEIGCPRITAFPLMLLKGTALYQEKEKYGFIEAPLGPFKIPTVVQSHSFNFKEWEKMHEFAQSLNSNERI
jgi:radical SAM superfamily enzyme YgiQ (UPF0313 family)